MLRRSGALFAAGAAGATGASGNSHNSRRHTFGEDNDDEGSERKRSHVEPGGYGMSLDDAYIIFEYKFGDEIKKAEVQKRFKALAKKAHPDLGGNEAAFRRLKEAQKIMLTHSHDKFNTVGKDGKSRTGRPKTRIVRETHAENTNTVTFENAEEHRQVGGAEWAFGVVIGALFLAAYATWFRDNVTKSNDGRSRMQEEQVRPLHEDKMGGKASNTWHPWRASTQTRQEVREWEEARRERAEKIRADRSPFVSTA